MNAETVPLGRVEVELYPEQCPMACENFLKLCTGEDVLDGHDARTQIHEATFADAKKPQLHYLHSVIHRVLPGFGVQGGGHRAVRWHGAGVCLWGDLCSPRRAPKGTHRSGRYARDSRRRTALTKRSVFLRHVTGRRPSHGGAVHLLWEGNAGVGGVEGSRDDGARLCTTSEV